MALPGTALGGAVGSRFGPMGEAQSGVVDLSYAAPAALPAVGEAYREAMDLLPEHLAGHGLGIVGLPRLRQAVADRYTARGVPTRPEQILVTHGAQQAMTLVVGLLTAPGDRVLVEHPTYPHTIEAITAAGGRVAPVALTTEDGAAGWDLDGIGRRSGSSPDPGLPDGRPPQPDRAGPGRGRAPGDHDAGPVRRMTVVVDESR